MSTLTPRIVPCQRCRLPVIEAARFEDRAATICLDANERQHSAGYVVVDNVVAVPVAAGDVTAAHQVHVCARPRRVRPRWLRAVPR